MESSTVVLLSVPSFSFANCTSGPSRNRSLNAIEFSSVTELAVPLGECVAGAWFGFLVSSDCVLITGSWSFLFTFRRVASCEGLFS
jgi:hypothetical protein